MSYFDDEDGYSYNEAEYMTSGYKTMEGYCFDCRKKCVALITNEEEASDECPASCELIAECCGDHCIDWDEYLYDKEYYDNLED